MFYCNPGDVLTVSPERNQSLDLFWRYWDEPPHATAMYAGSHKRFDILEGEYVIALEASVPPFYATDTIRCIYKESIIHIRRCDLINVNNTKTNNS